MASNSLPPAGTLVTAMTFESIEYDRPAVAITGPLFTRPLRTYVQCWVNDTQVDPDTVRPADGNTDATVP